MQTFVVFSKNLTGLRKGIQIEASCWHGKHYNIHVCPQSLNDLIYTNQWGMFGTNYQILCFSHVSSVDSDVSQFHLSLDFLHTLKPVQWVLLNGAA